MPIIFIFNSKFAQTTLTKALNNSGLSKMLVVWNIFRDALALRVNCPNTEFFLVHIFLYSD